jgi:hypothetical protein
MWHVVVYFILLFIASGLRGWGAPAYVVRRSAEEFCFMHHALFALAWLENNPPLPFFLHPSPKMQIKVENPRHKPNIYACICST